MALTGKISSAIFGGHEHAFISDGKKDVLINSVLSFTVENNSTVTKHAIEKGSDVTDHINTEPTKLNITGILTDDDFSATDPTGFGNEFISDRKKILDDWKVSKPILTYHGHEYDVESVQIENLSWSKTVEAGSGIQVSITLVVVNIASSQVTTLKNGVTNKGNTSKGTDTKPGSATTNTSWAKSITGLVGR